MVFSFRYWPAEVLLENRQLNVVLILWQLLQNCDVCSTIKENSSILYIHPFNGPLPGTTRVSRYWKGKTNLDFTEARDSEWQWHQLAICKSAPCSRQITTPAPHHSVFTGWMPYLPPNQQRQSTEGTDTRTVVGLLHINTHVKVYIRYLNRWCIIN